MARRSLPTTRTGITRAFRIRYRDSDGSIEEAGSDQASQPETEEIKTLKFWVTANVFDDGRLGEIFVRGDKIGGLLGGALDGLAIMISLALQHGVPSYVLTEKLRHHKFGPAGKTGDADFPACSSMFDLMAQWLDREFPEGRWVKMPKPKE